MPEVEATSLKDRIAAFAEEAAQERERLEAQRAELATQRDAEVNEIQERHMSALRAEVEEARQRWRERIAQATEELATLRRLDTALNPPPPKPKKPRSEPVELVPGKWTPTHATVLRVLRALAEGADTPRDAAAIAGMSREGVNNAIKAMRADGRVRLSGERKVGNTNARTYAMTPAGELWLSQNDEAKVPGPPLSGEEHDAVIAIGNNGAKA